jgi:UDP-hydrolysing UDP-N-acetyl-D-glucosamine 2-epimerase
MVITVADRFETIATAIAATYLNIPLVHLQGGEISGNIDERVRHSTTKLADLHFPATENSKARIIKMGENPKMIFNYGCPAMDVLVENDLSIDNQIMSGYGGTGKAMDWTEPYMLVLQHPVTTSYGEGLQQIKESLNAVVKYQEIQKVVIWPNIDAGTDDVSKGIRMFREKNRKEPIHYFRNFSPEDYARVLNNAVCAIGNSSSFIREGAFLGTPAVIVGDRQEGREHADNILFSGYDRCKITEKIGEQLKHGRFKPDHIFGSGNSGKKIADKLANVHINLKKRLTY